MKRLTKTELKSLLDSPLNKWINSGEVEAWASSLWHMRRETAARHSVKKTPNSLMLFPPPNITGNLHLGHALTGAIQDAIVRNLKMSRKNVIFVPGFDHAGLGAQSIVQKQLSHMQGPNRGTLGNQNFIDAANDWKDAKRNEMRDQLNRLGLDLDSHREYFTLDENSSHAVHEAFKRLFKSGIIFRDKKLVFWSKILETTLSDSDVDTVNGQNTFSRTGEIVDRVHRTQWFINTKELALHAREVVDNGKIKMIPRNYIHSWSSWLLNSKIDSWCISRQSWWGHKIPAYKLQSSEDMQQSWIVADDLDHARSLLGDQAVVQDTDVLDTWFSSSLLPLTVSGWPDDEKFSLSVKTGQFPLHIMETGFDILTYWVSKMVMISLALTDSIPFKTVILHGMICDGSGKKMSKSKGNVIDPVDIIRGASLEDLEKRSHDSHNKGILDTHQLNYALEVQRNLFPKGIPACGADGLRAYLLSQNYQKEVVRVQIPQLVKIRRLTNKIWSVYRFLLKVINDSDKVSDQLKLVDDFQALRNLCVDQSDENIIEELDKCTSLHLLEFNETYNLHKVLNSLEALWVTHLSGRYLATNKNYITSQNSAYPMYRERKIIILTKCVQLLTQLTHPFMPHLTEFMHFKLSNELRSKDRGGFDIDKVELLTKITTVTGNTID